MVLTDGVPTPREKPDVSNDYVGGGEESSGADTRSCGVVALPTPLSRRVP